MELPGFKPYFEVLDGRCAVEARDRTHATIRCEGAAKLVRRELYFPGWVATVNGVETTIAEHGDLFQAIALPAGVNEVSFAFAPPHSGWAWLAMLLAGVSLVAPSIRRPRPKG